MSHDTELLSRTIDEKHACLRQLRDMGKRQAALVQAGTMTELLDVLSAKQRVLNRLQRIQRALDPFRDQDAAERRWPSEDDRRRCARQIDECEAMLAEIAAGEKACQQELIRRRDETAVQLQSVEHAISARGAYIDRPQTVGSRLDLTCGE